MICPKCGRQLTEDNATCDFCKKYAINSQKPIENLDEYMESFKVDSIIDIYLKRIKRAWNGYWEEKTVVAKVCLIIFALMIIFWGTMIILYFQAQNNPEIKLVNKVERYIREHNSYKVIKLYPHELREQGKIDLHNQYSFINSFVFGLGSKASDISGQFEEVDIDESKIYKDYDQLENYLVKTYGLDRDKITDFKTYQGQFIKVEDNLFNNSTYQSDEYICIILIKYDGRWGLCSFEEYMSKNRKY